MNKKISIFIHHLSGGGAEGVCVTLANALADRRLDIDLVVSCKEVGIRANKLSNNVHLVTLNVNHARSAVIPIWRYLIAFKPDIVLSFNRQLSIVIGIIRYLSRIHFKLISRNIIFLSLAEGYKKQYSGFWHGNIINILIRKFFPLSDMFIAQCCSMKEDLSAYLKIDKNKIVVINNPVNNEIENYMKNIPQSVDIKENYLLCIGRLEHQKAYHYAIEAFSRITEDYPQLRLKMLGQGSMENQLKKIVSDFNISDKVDFEGYQEDIIPYYVHARLTMLTSLFEGFPNILIESITLGTPVVSFDCPSGPNEIIQDGVNGYLAKYQDTDDLAECLRRALDRQWEPEIVRATAERFSSEKIIDEYERVLS